jgi:Cof subfamily protein (haloacid dehalogenase superfamily)
MDNIRVIVSDMDGTLLNDNKELSENTVKAFIRAQKQGYTMVLATGRGINMVMDFAKKLKMDEYGGYIVGFNGQQVIELATNTFHENEYLEPEITKSVFKFAKKHSLQLVLENKNGFLIYTPWILLPLRLYAIYIKLRHKRMQKKNETYHLMSGYLVNPSFKVETLSSMKQLDEPVAKMGVSQYNGWMRKKYPRIMHAFENQITITRVAPFWIDIMPKGMNKSIGLKWVSERLGIPTSDFIAFGDAENDAAMMREVGVSIAMKNAMKNLKKITTTSIDETNNEDGVAVTINKICEGTFVV